MLRNLGHARPNRLRIDRHRPETTAEPATTAPATSTEGEPLAQLETGAEVTIVSGPTEVDGIAWFEITSGDLTGFVAGQYLGVPSE
jgi:hypothetical protein